MWWWLQAGRRLLDTAACRWGAGSAGRGRYAVLLKAVQKLPAGLKLVHAAGRGYQPLCSAAQSSTAAVKSASYRTISLSRSRVGEPSASRPLLTKRCSRPRAAVFSHLSGSKSSLCGAARYSTHTRHAVC